MKCFVVLASLIATSIAQGIQIGVPAAGDTISPGQNITVEVDRPQSLTPSDDVAIVISIGACPTTGCDDPSFDVTADLGTVLYQGPYDAQYDSSRGADHKPPYQNFTVQVPTYLTSGQEAVLSVVHLALVEAGPHVLFETKNITLIVG